MTCIYISNKLSRKNYWATTWHGSCIMYKTCPYPWWKCSSARMVVIWVSARSNFDVPNIWVGSCMMHGTCIPTHPSEKNWSSSARGVLVDVIRWSDHAWHMYFTYMASLIVPGWSSGARRVLVGVIRWSDHAQHHVLYLCGILDCPWMKLWC